MPTFLSVDQFQTILETPNAVRRAGLGRRLYADFDAGMLDLQERQAGLSIFRALARDDNDEVRRDFARFVATFQDLPADLADTIANDPVRRIAVPFLRLGVGIGDCVLVDVVGCGEGWRQSAVAARRVVNVPVCAAISEVGEAGCVKTLLNNPGAALPSAILGRIAERFGDNDDIAALLLDNPRVPGRFVETQIHAVSDRLKAFVDLTGWIDPESSSGALANAVEHSLVEFAVGRGRAELVPIFAKWVAERRITRGFVLRAACYGAISLLELALGKFAGLPADRVTALMADASGYGRQSLVARAGFGDWEEEFITKAIARFMDRHGGMPPGQWRLAVAGGIEDVLGNASSPEAFSTLLEGFATDFDLVTPVANGAPMKQAA